MPPNTHINDLGLDEETVQKLESMGMEFLLDIEDMIADDSISVLSERMQRDIYGCISLDEGWEGVDYL